MTKHAEREQAKIEDMLGMPPSKPRQGELFPQSPTPLMPRRVRDPLTLPLFTQEVLDNNT